MQIVNYMPIEGDLTDLEAARTVGLVDHCILYTEFARKNLRSLCQRLEQRIFSFVPQSFTYCPMELTQRRFWPYSGASVARQGNCSRVGVREKLFPGLPLVHTGFLVLNANRPFTANDWILPSRALHASQKGSQKTYLFTCIRPRQTTTQISGCVDWS